MLLKNNVNEFIKGILTKITNSNLYSSIKIKYAIERKIDCIMWNIRKDFMLFFKNAANINHIKPAIPAVKYVAAEIILSIMLMLL